MIISIPYNVPSLNKTSRQHWRSRVRDVNMCTALVRAHGWYSCNAKGRRSLLISSYRRQLCRDIQNYIGGCKSLTDGVTKAGALVDDSDKWAFISYEQHLLRDMPDELRAKFGGNPCTVLTLTDMEPL